MGKREYRKAPVERLRELFEVRDGQLFRIADQGKAKAGTLAGNRHNAGYLRVRVDGDYLLVHRVVLAITTGKWPDKDVDHRNGKGTENDPANLREATHAENMRNGRRRKNNTSGAPGVSWNIQRRKWEVTVSHNGTTRHFGRHDDFEFAELVASEVRHRLFGAFAPVLS